MTKHFFSVIITTYNRSQIVTRALKSLVAQTERDWEAIIIDDGSTDDTASRLSEYIEGAFNITYIKQENKGEEGAKNAGIEAAQGQYITFLDSDDMYDPIHLEKRKSILRKHPHIDLLHGGVEIIGDEYVPNRLNPKRKIHLDDCVIGGTFFVRRTLLLSLGGFRKVPIGTDADLFERITLLGAKVLKVEHPTYIYNRGIADSLTHKFFEKFNTVK